MKPQTCTLHVLSMAAIVNVDAFWRETRAKSAKQLGTVGLGVLGIGFEISTETV